MWSHLVCLFRLGYCDTRAVFARRADRQRVLVLSLSRAAIRPPYPVNGDVVVENVVLIDGNRVFIYWPYSLLPSRHIYACQGLPG